MLELQRPDSLVVRVVSAIRAEIDSGQLAPESRLPTEQQLAEQLNVSRSVVREAIAQLKADGVLTAKRGLGSIYLANPCGYGVPLPGKKRSSSGPGADVRSAPVDRNPGRLDRRPTP